MSTAALVIAHPGHELRVHGWLVRRRPHVFVLTDGSGRTGRSRLASTTAVLEAAGSFRAPVYGRFSDAEIYRALMARDAAPFIDLATRMAATFGELYIDEVVSDALEGYNPAHDLCCYVADAAAEISRSAGRRLARYEFPLAAPPDAGGASLGDVRIELSPEELEAKHRAAAGYAELAGEVDNSLRSIGWDAFRVERLRLVEPGRTEPPEDPPRYERFGEDRVAAGRYASVLRFREHVRPVAAALAGVARLDHACAS